MLLAGLLLHLLAFGTLVAPVFSLRFNFTSVQQCAPILLSFSGLTSTVSGAPASLTILPFNSTAIVIPLQNVTFSTGIGLNYLPFAASSQFLVSLDDVGGSNIINVSDIIPVLPSSNNNSTCIPTGRALPRSFALASPVVSQCQNFTINYNTTLVSQAPNVRLYSPSGPSFLLDLASDNSTLGVATYTMAFSYGHDVILLMDDGNGTGETTILLTVGGDSSSPGDCLLTGTLSTDTTVPSHSFRIIIICATVGGVAILLGTCTAIFVLRNRRRRRAQHLRFDRTRFKNDEKGQVKEDFFPTGFSTGPIFTSKSFLSPPKDVYDGNSLASWSQAIPEDQCHSASLEANISSTIPDRLSAQALDIERMLNMAILQPETIVNNGKKSNSIIFGSPAVPQPALLQPPMIFRSLSGRHLRAPSDVPADLNSRTCSTYSTVSANPSNGYPLVIVTESPSLQTPTAPSLGGGRSINTRFIGLPSSPRDGLRANLLKSNKSIST